MIRKRRATVGGGKVVRSMTGFGRGEASGPVGRIVVEIKAVNHRFSEVVFRMPRLFGALEELARKLILGRINRGRLEVFVSWEAAAEARGVKVDKELALAYYYALKQLGEEIGSKSELSLDTLAKLPDVLKVEEAEVTAEQIWPTMQDAAAQAVDNLIAMREREGMLLASDLTDRLFKLTAFGQAVAGRSPQVVAEYRSRLVKRLDELLPQVNAIDPQRLAQEVALYADRCDITEEVGRLGSHLSQFRAALASDEPVGRKLDFLVQEIGREVNTIGAKANDADITREVVEAKSELEKVREQIQNME